MKRLLYVIFLLFTILNLAARGPVISDVQVVPQVGRVLIRYHLAHPDNASCDVSLDISSDGGANYDIKPSALIGDIGVVQATLEGAYHEIIWHPAQDGLPPGDNYAARVMADDHEIPLISINMDTIEGAPGTILNFSTDTPLQEDDGYSVHFGDFVIPLYSAGADTLFTTVVPVISPLTTSIAIFREDEAISESFAFTVLPMPDTGMPPGQLTSYLLDEYVYLIQSIIGDFLPNLMQSGIFTVNNNALMQDRLNTLSNYMGNVNIALDQMTIEEKTQLDQLMLSSGVYEQTKQLRHFLDSAVNTVADMGKTSYIMNAYLLTMDGMSVALSLLSRAISIAGAAAALPSFGLSAAAAGVISTIIMVLDGFIDTYIPTDIDSIYVEGGVQPDNIHVPMNGDTPIVLMGKFVPQSNPTSFQWTATINSLCTTWGFGPWFNLIVSVASSIGMNLNEDLSFATDEWQSQEYYEYPVNPLFYNMGFSNLSDLWENLLGFAMPMTQWTSIFALLTGVEYDTVDYDIASYNVYNHELHGNGEGYTWLVYNVFSFKKRMTWWNSGLIELPFSLDNEDIAPCRIVVAPAPVNQINITSTPSEADIYLDGQYAAQTPASVNVSYDGLHTIQLFKQGYNDYYAEVTTTPGGSYNVHAVLTQAGFPLPIVTLTSPGNNDTYYGEDVNVRGSIYLEDSQGNLYSFEGNQAILQMNDQNQIISVYNNHFQEVLSLSPGTYQITIRCNTENGITGFSEPVMIFVSDTVAPPQFFPPPTVYDGPQNVYMESATPEAQIYYTTDGSDPSQSSQLYQGPIYIATTTTLKARAYKQGVSPSPVTSGTYTITVPSDFIYVPGGTFTMGDTRGLGFSDELPTHTVTLNSFYIGKYEVTQAEYSQYMPSPNWTSSYGLGDNYPAYRVSWYAILKYCNLRSMAEGLTPCYTISGSTDPADWGEVPTSNNSTWDAAICNWNANGYRLPTEAEWEYAARGATNNPDYLYSGSDDINAVAWYTNNSGSSTHPVGTKAPNGIGTYDMSGNVWEWCWDWYSSSYYSSSPQDNPTGPASGSSRVFRGGSWSYNAYYCTVSFRLDYFATYSHYSLGFRVCRAAN